MIFLAEVIPCMVAILMLTPLRRDLNKMIGIFCFKIYCSTNHLRFTYTLTKHILSEKRLYLMFTLLNKPE